MMNDFQQTQYTFTAHLRAPDETPAPAGIEARRVAIYRDLIYNNIEGFIAGAFPVLRRLYEDAAWHAMVRDFIKTHQAHTPYFLEISQEFLVYLLHERGRVETDPPFLLELAHYEWVELMLDVSTAELPEPGNTPANLLDTYPRVSPLAMNLAYQYPVHKIAPVFRPEVPEVTWLVVYRNAKDQVKFMESNALTHRLLHLLQEHPSHSLKTILQQIAHESGHTDPERLFSDGESLLRQLHQLTVISHFE